MDIELVDKTVMEEALLKAYSLTLTQANTTPCMTSPLKDVFEDYSTSYDSHKIIHGDTSILDEGLDGVDESTIEVLKYLTLKGDGT